MSSLPNNPRACMAALRLVVLLPMLGATAAGDVARSDEPAGPQPSEPVAEVRFELDRNKILLPLRVNGFGPVDFVLDTGAPQNVIFSGAASDSMALVVTGQARVHGAGKGGAIEASLVGGITLGLGDLTFSDESALLIPTHDGDAHWGDRPLAGIVGPAILSRFIVELDFQRRVMRLFEPAMYAYDGDGSVLDVWLERGHPHVNATLLEADGTSTEIELVVDTGARPALIVGLPNEAAIEAPAAAPRDRIGKGLSGEIFARLGRIGGLRLGGHVLPDVIAGYADADLRIAPGATANLGVESLRRFTVVFDYAGRRMIVEPNRAFTDPFEWDMSGLRLAAGEWPGSIVVESLRAGSPAERAGIRGGDRIVSIAGRGPGDDLDLDAADRLLSQGDGVSVSIVLERDGQLVQVQLVLERLV